MNDNKTQRFSARSFVFASIASLVLLGSANVVRVFMQPDPDRSFGFPFEVYSYSEILSRGRFYWEGALGNLLVAVVLAILFALIHKTVLK